MKRFRVAVCKGPDCREGGSDRVFAALREALTEQELASRCELYRGGCYGLCHLGPNVVVREDTGRKRDLLSREDFQLMGWEGERHHAEVTVEHVPALVATLKEDPEG